MYTFNTPLTSVSGVGAKLGQTLAAHDVKTVRDLLILLPLRYEDRRLQLTVTQVQDQGESLTTPVTILATVKKISQQWKGRRSIQRGVIEDETGSLKVTWFNSPFVVQTLQKPGQFFFSGQWNHQYQTLQQPAVERVTDQAALHTARLVPMYSSTIGISSGWLRRIARTIFEKLTGETELIDALKQLHFPEEPMAVVRARQRIALEELLSLMEQAAVLKAEWTAQTAQQSLTDPAVPQRLKKLLAQLPFELTGGQQQALAEILDDVARTTPMNRLLQGDVGAGKTVVALLVAQLFVEQGETVCLMAPTRILAQQHSATVAQLFPDLPQELVLGGTKKQTKHSTEPKLIIGTHALINQLKTRKPALVIFDEQQRFGVQQRTLSAKTDDRVPHVLTMTATPIPRSLLLTIFAHLSLSVIGEQPKDRKPTKTWYIPERKRAESYQWLAEQASLPESLVIVVCPFIDPSTTESLENVAAATELFERVKKSMPKSIRVALLHGKQAKNEQQDVISQAYDGNIDVIVATPIVEVGIDLPQASVMVIEAADRFGLASLHQLRGRVGRRGQQGYCLVFSATKDAEARERLKAFAQTTDGQKIAELDLQNRGGGNLFGVEQHGFGQLQFASWADVKLIAEAQKRYEQLPDGWTSPLFKPEQSTTVAAN